MSQLLIFALLLTVPLACLGMTTQDVTLVYGAPYDLNCKDVAQGTSTKWFFNGTEVLEDTKKYTIFAENATLRIIKVDKTTAANYACLPGTNETNKITFNVRVKPHAGAFDKAKNVIQGDPLSLECKAFGIPTPTIRWERDGVVLVSDGVRIELKLSQGSNDLPQLENGTLRIEEMDYPDIGNYSCFVTNEIDGDGGTTVNATLVVQVKDKYAALWPFFGICIEVAILCAIILIYEKRRAKRIEEEERQEEAAHLNANNDTKAPIPDEVRQRK